MDAEPQLHRALGLYEGLRQIGGPWPNLLLMCAGIGSPGTLAEVLRGYTGDRSAPLAADPGGVLRQSWRTYVPRDDFLTQRGGTLLLEADDTLLYSYRDRGIL